jgi:hypothetical protein
MVVSSCGGVVAVGHRRGCFAEVATVAAAAADLVPHKS